MNKFGRGYQLYIILAVFSLLLLTGISRDVHALTLYDDFAAIRIDPAKWSTLEFKRILKNGELRSEAVNINDARIQNNLDFINPSNITYMEADVKINDISGNYDLGNTNLNSYPMAGLVGYFYNDGSGTAGSSLGLALVSVRIALWRGQLRAEWQVLKGADANYDSWTWIEGKPFSIPIVFGQVYKLSMLWEPASKTFTFKANDETQKWISPDTTINPPTSTWKAVKTDTWVSPGTNLWCKVDANFDNIFAKDGNGNIVVSDDFSSTTGLLDTAKWKNSEFFRGIRDNKLHLFVQNHPNNLAPYESAMQIKGAENVNELQAKVTLTSFSNISGVLARTGISGSFFNDGTTGAGALGDISAKVEIGGTGTTPVGQWAVFRAGATAPETISSGTFSKPIVINTEYTLCLGWDGTKFTFKIDDEEGSYTPDNQTKNAPKMPNKKLSAFIVPTATNQNVLVGGLFDDVMIGYSPKVDQIRANFAAAIDAYNIKSETFFTNYVSANYHDKGEGYSTFYANIHNEWNSGTFRTRTYTVSSTTVTGPDTATMNITWMNGETDTLYFKNESGTWKMYGNQQKHNVNFMSFHQDRYFDGTTDGTYSVGIDIQDPHNTVISATVSGTGITSPLPFAKHGTGWCIGNQVNFGTTPPSNAAYVVSVIDVSGTYTYNGTVNGGVAAFATNLSPTGTITGAITFTFNGISGGERYNVNLFDASWNQMWNSSYDNTGTTIPYTGTALTSGTYYYQIQSNIGDNTSAALAQFVYTASAAIYITNQVRDASGAVANAKVEVAGNASVPAVYTDTNGIFTLTGIPSGQDFTLRVSKDGYSPSYSPVFNSTSNMTAGRYFYLYPANFKTSNGNSESMGIIHARAREDSSNWENSFISGAVITATINGNPATVEYFNDFASTFGGTSTFGNGMWYVRNINPGDVVQVTCTKPGITFPSRKYVSFADGVTSGSLFGIADTNTVWVTGSVTLPFSTTPVAGVTVEMVGNATKTVTTNDDGSFTLTKLPKLTKFDLKFTKSGYTPSYQTNMNPGGNIPFFQRPIMLYNSGQLATWGVASGKGALMGGVRNSINPSTMNISGARVTGVSPYSVTYVDATGDFSGSTTSSRGTFYVFNITAGDTVTLTASESGYIFTTNYATAYADSITFTGINGTALSSDQTAVETAFDAAIQAYNDRNIDGFMSYFSASFVNYRGENYDQFRARTVSELSDPTLEAKTYTINSVTVTGDTARLSITMGSGTAKAYYFKMENGSWKIFLEQRYIVWAHSNHWQETLQYGAQLGVNDPNHTATSVAVTGPSITGTLYLEYIPGAAQWWIPRDMPVLYGTSAPVNATYTFVVTDPSGSLTYNDTVNGGVADFPSYIQPAGNVSGQITFTFTGISGGQAYTVHVFDANWSPIWYFDAGNTTTIPYAGITLSTGTYNYIIAGMTDTNIGNTSSVSGQFSYTAGEPSPTVTLISNDAALGTPRYLATDRTRLYVAAVVGGVQKILSLPIGGGTVTTLYNAVNPMKVTVLGDYIYWIDPNSGTGTGTNIWKAPKDGSGTPTAIYDGSSIVDGSGIVAGGDGKLYTSDEWAGRVHTLNPDGTALAQIGGDRFPAGFAPYEHLNTIAESGGILYIADQGKSGVISAQVASIPTSGGSFTTLSSDFSFNSLNDIAVGNGMIYIADYGATTIWKMPVSGGTPTVLVSGSPFVKIHGLTYFNNALYVADDEGKAIYKVVLGQQLATEISLSQGWNFISFPKVPSTNTTAEVLKDVSSNVRVVWGYNNSTKEWLKYTGQGTLTTIETGKGYWIYMNAAGMIDIINWSAPSTTTITLYPGWNLVGYNGTSSTSLPAGYVIIWNWANGVWYVKKAAAPQTATLTGVEQKKAYWIKMDSAQLW